MVPEIELRRKSDNQVVTFYENISPRHDVLTSQNSLSSTRFFLLASKSTVDKIRWLVLWRPPCHLEKQELNFHIKDKSRSNYQTANYYESLDDYLKKDWKAEWRKRHLLSEHDTE